ncbi:MAG: hypothetical protein QXV17_09775 [Candidatus Micrarchaeaceae archaeon]
MVNIEDIYGPSEYLKAADLPPKPVKYKIQDVYTDTFFQNNTVVTKVVLALEGTKKHFIVNRTNAYILADMFGKEADAWKGKEITVVKQLIKMSDGTEGFTIVVQRGKENVP